MQEGDVFGFVVLSSIKGNIHCEVINRKRTSNTNTKSRGMKMKGIFFLTKDKKNAEAWAFKGVVLCMPPAVCEQE